MMKKLLIAASLLMIPVATPAFGSDAHGPAKDLTIPIIAVDNPGQYGGHAFHGSFKRLPAVRLDGGETYNVGVIKSKAVKGEIPMDPLNRTWHQEDPVRETSYNQYNQSWEQAPATIWNDASATEVPMGPQNLVMPGLVVATVPLVKIKSIHNGKDIAFWLTWYDSTKSETETMEDKFSDAIAVMFPVKAGSEPSFMMGDDENPVHIVYWKAAWERDIEFGYQDVRDAYDRSIAWLRKRSSNRHGNACNGHATACNGHATYCEPSSQPGPWAGSFARRWQMQLWRFRCLQACLSSSFGQ